MEGLSVKNTFIDVCPVDDVSSEDSSPRVGSPKRNASAPPSPLRRRGGGQDFLNDPEEAGEQDSVFPGFQWSEDGTQVLDTYGAGGDVMSGLGTVLRGGAGVDDAEYEGIGGGFLRGAYEPPFFSNAMHGLVRPDIHHPNGAHLPSLDQLGLHTGVPAGHGAMGGEYGDDLSSGVGPAYITKKGARGRSRDRGSAAAAAVGYDDTGGDESGVWPGAYQVGHGMMGYGASGPMPGGDCFSLPTYGLPAGSASGYGSNLPLSGMLGDAGDRRPEAPRPSDKTGLERFALAGDAGDRRVDGDAGDRRPQHHAVYGLPGMQTAFLAAPTWPGGLSASSGAGFGAEAWGGRETRERGRRTERDSGKGGGKSGKKFGGDGPGGSGGRGQPMMEQRRAGHDRPEKSQPWVAAGVADSTLFDDTGGTSKAGGGMSGGGPKRTDYQKKYGGAEDDDAGAGDKLPITTMMLKNIPCRKSQQEVMSHIDVSGFSGTYDFFYLPCDTKFRANLGYAFVNFMTPEDAERFSQAMDGYRFPGSGSNKACAVVPAHVQGLVNNLSAFKRTEVMRSRRKPYFSAIQGVD
eukprot:TRINITY_DN46775_c0_g1_i1.p1 TRINITY_DN46775_c0_g1~~TRINITY_DN46775_c0_g1_i1.p1  ORF type:complete len:573 (-),score=107.29 TRINITY_DN46775_c0_g1_i1:140-1858(-)